MSRGVRDMGITGPDTYGFDEAILLSFNTVQSFTRTGPSSP